MTNHTERIKIDISVTAIIKVLAVILGLIFLHKIQDILLMLFVVLILVTALSPVVDRIVAQVKVPRWLAVTFIFGGIALAVLIIVLLIFPLVFQQVLELLNQTQIKNVLGGAESSSAIDEVRFLYDHIPVSGQGASGFVSFFASVFGGIVSVFTVIVLSVYLLLDEDGIKKFIVSFLPLNHKHQIVGTFHKISLKMGAWLRGQLLLGLIVGLLDLVILFAFGAPYWLTLAIFAGFTELIPYIGPFIGLSAALFVVLTKDSLWGLSPYTVAIGVGIGMLMVQQLEAHFLVPKVMQKTVGLSPVIVIIAILIGAKLFGLLGVVLSVPVAAAISVIIDEWPAIQAAYLANRAEMADTLAKE